MLGTSPPSGVAHKNLGRRGKIRGEGKMAGTTGGGKKEKEGVGSRGTKCNPARPPFVQRKTPSCNALKHLSRLFGGFSCCSLHALPIDSISAPQHPLTDT